MSLTAISPKGTSFTPHIRGFRIVLNIFFHYPGSCLSPPLSLSFPPLNSCFTFTLLHDNPPLQGEMHQSAALRAFHPEEVAKQEHLEVDKTYYLQHQVHAVVSRLCEPIQGLEPALLADCLGMCTQIISVHAHIFQKNGRIINAYPEYVRVLAAVCFSVLGLIALNLSGTNVWCCRSFVEITLGVLITYNQDLLTISTSCTNQFITCLYQFAQRNKTSLLLLWQEIQWKINSDYPYRSICPKPM